MSRVSTGDTGYVHPYLVARVYLEIATELKEKYKNHPKMVKMLDKQIADCIKEMGKKAL